MIQFITGVVGAGKTLHAVRLCCDYLRAGRTIVTNVELYPERVQECIARQWGVMIHLDQIRHFDPEKTPNWETEIPWGDDRGCPVCVVLDETHLFYNSRDWSKTQTQSKQLLDFLTQSRKAAVDVIWITQDGDNVDKQFRVLAEWQLAIVSTEHLPLGWIGKLPFKAYVVKHVSAKSGNVVRKKWWGYDKWLFGLYKTESFLSGRMRELSDGVERVGRRELGKVSTWARCKLWLRFYLGNFRKAKA